MPRTLNDSKLDSRSSRIRLKIRREPYWRSLSEGLAVGYRKGAKGGTWIARHYTEEHGRQYKALGTTDDVADADGANILSFSHAQEAARQWFTELARQDGGYQKDSPYTIREAMADYVIDYKRRGKKAAYVLELIVGAHIIPKLGDKAVSKLTRRIIENWLDDMATTPARARTKAGKDQKFRRPSDNDEMLRKRRNTANRVLTVLKAALNLAHHNRRAQNRDTWEAVKPYKNVDAPKIRYISDTEAKRLVNACPHDLRQIVIAALLTGCRYGEIATLKASDFNPDSKTLHIPQSKSGKPRHVVLTDEGSDFFADAIAGLKGIELIFTRQGGAKWNHANQFRPLKDACVRAKIEPAISFHILRHTYASRLAMQGVPMSVIAKQLGHADERITQRHYAHLSPSYVADTIRAAFTSMGLVKKSRITSIKGKPLTKIKRTRS